MNFLWLLFNFDGRIGRLSYWLGCLLSTVIGLAPIAFVATLGRSAGMSGVSLATLLFLFLLFLILLTVMNLAIVAKRLHDRDKSLLWYLVIFIPIIGPLWMFIELGFLAGSQGINRFGSPPGSMAYTDDSDFDAGAVVRRWQEKQARETAYSQAPAVVERVSGPQRSLPNSRPTFGRRGLT
ncbi:DUF805 domain-containing protein [Pleomorphomonas carboxyditropha]|uniref:DUF805 domain-containing protein n=1 Tax=Pleomorphomonas carboxyditropha TaxID=2023338 RepID=A0A2G9WNW0_9HYPH|nr:DUF805 domain-containing protein [Pleomorphomonas carboxyditropha]PIO96386.1 hypothetical protein CJ014_25755 [Pleomorphomonas carboxyditropha]